MNDLTLAITFDRLVLTLNLIDAVTLAEANAYTDKKVIDSGAETPETIKEKYESNQSVIDRIARLENTSGTNTGDQDLSDFVTTEQLSLKVDKEIGKGLSTNDYTTEDRNKFLSDPIPLFCSDMKTDITASNIEPKIRFTFEEARTLTGVVGSLSVASVGGIFTVDIKKNGTSIFSTLLTFDSGESTTRTASVPYVLTGNVSFAIGDYVDIFVTIVGSSAAGKGLLITLLTTK